jgi:hypothetical protein
MDAAPPRPVVFIVYHAFQRPLENLGVDEKITVIGVAYSA